LSSTVVVLPVRCFLEKLYISKRDLRKGSYFDIIASVVRKARWINSKRKHDTVEVSGLRFKEKI
jgi:hypothetical protein